MSGEKPHTLGLEILSKFGAYLRIRSETPPEVERHLHQRLLRYLGLPNNTEFTDIMRLLRQKKVIELSKIHGYLLYGEDANYGSIMLREAVAKSPRNLKAVYGPPDSFEGLNLRISKGHHYYELAFVPLGIADRVRGKSSLVVLLGLIDLETIISESESLFRQNSVLVADTNPIMARALFNLGFAVSSLVTYFKKGPASVWIKQNGAEVEREFPKFEALQRNSQNWNNTSVRRYVTVFNTSVRLTAPEMVEKIKLVKEALLSKYREEWQMESEEEIIKELRIDAIRYLLCS